MFVSIYGNLKHVYTINKHNEQQQHYQSRIWKNRWGRTVEKERRGRGRRRVMSQ